MAVRGFFYNSVNMDRSYDGQDMNMNKAPFYKEGVFFGHLAVTAEGQSMTVRVDGGDRTGFAFINYKTIHNNAVVQLTVGQAHATLPRIDRVILRNNETMRMPDILIIEGAYSNNPQPPALTNNDTIQEKCLAEISVAAGAVRITQANIKDTRADASICGFVATQFNEVDFGFFSRQFDQWMTEFKTYYVEGMENWTYEQKEVLRAMLAEMDAHITRTKSDYQADMDEYTANQQLSFDNWFGAARDQLSEDAAGNLFNNKTDIVVVDGDLPVNMRAPKTFYFMVKQKATVFDEVITVSPNMGLIVG